MDSLFPAFYILAAAGFILAIKWMSSPATARRGVIVGEIGMLLAVVGTLFALRLSTTNGSSSHFWWVPPSACRSLT